MYVNVCLFICLSVFGVCVYVSVCMCVCFIDCVSECVCLEYEMYARNPKVLYINMGSINNNSILHKTHLENIHNRNTKQSLGRYIIRKPTTRMNKILKQAFSKAP